MRSKLLARALGGSGMEFRVLGPFEVHDGDEALPIGAFRQRAVLALLTIHAGQVVSTDRIIDEIWAGSPPAAALKTLHAYVSRLRRALQPLEAETGHQLLVSREPGYMLAIEPFQIDAVRFERMVDEASTAFKRKSAELAATTVREAMRLWRGTALADFVYEPFAASESQRLTARRMEAIELRIDAELALAHHASLVAELEGLVAEHPLREKLWAQLVTALYRCGRQADALAAYGRVRRSLVEELGIEPGPDLRLLERQVLEQSPALGWTPLGRTDDPERIPTSAHLAEGRVIEGRPATDWFPALPSALAVQTSLPFVGREAELKALDETWKESVSGIRRTVFIGGEAGIGKTRLVSEFGRSVHADGATVLYGRCDEDLGVSYQPFALALGHYSGQRGEGDLGGDHPDLTRVLPELGIEKLPFSVPAADPGMERWRLFEDFARWLDSTSARRPLLLVLEDLHWAAVPSLLLLRHIVRDKDPASLLILCTYRDTELERGHPLRSILADLRPEDGVSRLALSGLDEDGVIAYLEASEFGLDERGRLMARVLCEDANGNPLFIGEAFRHLIETGAVTVTPTGQWIFDQPLSSIGNLPSVRDVIDRRIARLSPSAHQALTVAACCGVEFELGLIEAVLDGGDWILQDLDRAVGAGIVEELPGVGRYAFSHALVRSALYEQLSVTRRSRIHGQLGAAIERIYSDDLTPFFSILCSHFAKAEDRPSRAKAAHYALMAAQRSLHQLAAEEALDDATIGLDLLSLEPRPDRTLRADLHLARAQAVLFSGDVAGSRDAAAAAAADARAIGSASRMIAAASARGWHASPGDSDSMVPELCTEALRMTGTTDAELRARGLATLALYTAINEGKATDADPLADESVQLSRSLQDPQLLWQALYARSHSLWPSERIADRLSIADEMVRLADQLGEQERHQSYFLRGVVRLENADRKGFEADLANVDRLAIASRGYWVPTAVTNLWRALLFLLDGAIEKAEACALEGLTAVPGSDLIFPTSFGAQLFAIRREQGRLREFISGPGTVPTQRALPAVRAGLALAHAEVGDLDTAGRFLADLVADGQSVLRRDSTWAIQLADLADVVDIAGASEHADYLYRLLAPRTGQLVVASLGCFCAGAVDRYLGTMAGLLGHHDLAVQHFEQALELENHLGSQPLVVRTKVAYARMLMHRGDENGRARGKELLDGLIPACRDIGLSALERTATALRGLSEP